MISNNNGEEYSKLILSQQEYDSKTLSYRRGEILDTNGTKLAVSEKVYNLVIDSKVMHYKDGTYMDPTVEALTACFALDETELRKYLEENQESSYYVPLKQLSYEEVQYFEDYCEKNELNSLIYGVWFEEEYKRVYPNDSLACDVIGFVRSDNVGIYGLEEYYNSVLSGTNGREFGYLNESNTLERTTIPAVDGYNLVTSIDANVQKIVEKYVLEFNEEYANNARDGAGSTNTGVIIMDPNTGEIIAMANYPTFDLNNPYDLSGIYTADEIAEMDADTKSEEQQSLWRNFCIFNTYEPGSTAKPFTVATGLEYGSLIGNETFYCGGSLEVSGHTIKCNNVNGHGTLNIAGALAESCNVALMKIAAIIGKEDFMKSIGDFNFGLKTNIDLVGETRTDGLIYNPEDMVASDLAVSSFGQGFNVTMIQLASGFSSIINGGNYYEPHVVTKIVTKDGMTVENIEPRIIKQTISEETSTQMVEYLDGVVTNGTGASARPAGYTMGGKTGTAEKSKINASGVSERDTENYVVSFIGYMPAENPEVLIYVVIDEPNVADQAHSGYATALVRAIMTEAAPYLGLYQTEELSEKEKEEMLELDKTLWFKNIDDSAKESISEGVDTENEDTENEDVKEEDTEIEDTDGE
jgi:stage V sporulation protein D (sporulation-specific penicillin-binding protein)